MTDDQRPARTDPQAGHQGEHHETDRVGELSETLSVPVTGRKQAQGPVANDHPAADWKGWTRIDAHAHTRASDGPVFAALGLIGVPECYSEPEAVYDQAMARGMELVTITDHDTVDGAMELVERGFERFIPGEEVTVYFPEDRCKLHVTVWGITPELHEEIAKERLNDDVYRFAAWLRDRDLAHALAHPVYIQNRRLSLWHLERCALLFRAFELINGAHSSQHVAGVERMLDWLSPERIRALTEKHQLKPLWDRSWVKGMTGGSDDHGLLNVGRTFTAVRNEDGLHATDHVASEGAAQAVGPITDPADFFRLVMEGRSIAGGVSGHAALLAHQITTVGAHYTAKRMADDMDPGQKYFSNKLLRFAGAHVDKPTKVSLAWHTAKRKMLLGKRKSRSLPITKALRSELKPLLEQCPEIKDRLDPAAWISGSALSQHEEMANFADDLSSALSKAMASGAIDALRKRDKVGIVDHLLSYGVLLAAQLPYIFSLFYQNKERNLVEQLNHQLGEPGSGVSALERPMKISLFTDTLGDVNGVSRFIQNVAEFANKTDRDLEVITSTTFDCPDWPNIYNFEPQFASKLPKYENLDMVLPPVTRILRHVDKHQPDVIHISTPGPVGVVGYIAAKMLRIPVLGVYHTDFPAYIDHLFDDDSLTWMTRRFMHWFYKPFWAIFTRSEDYVESLVSLGLDRDRCLSLQPGVDTDTFHTRYRDPAIWKTVAADTASGVTESKNLDVKSLGQIDPDSVKVCFIGRVSVEKNMPHLTRVWKKASAEIKKRGLNAELVVVGDGPYRREMEKALKNTRARFTGFRHKSQLSTLYATCDLFVFPSTTDTLGQVVMEAQASGMPVLVTDQGGPQEVVRHGKTGYVIPTEHEDEWAARIVELVEDTARRQSMGAAGHEAMQSLNLRASFEHFWQVHVEAWHKHLHELGIKPIPGGSGQVAPKPVG
ncbi:MAG: glycosyltransferase [Planctomycetota bacterium]